MRDFIARCGLFFRLLWTGFKTIFNYGDKKYDVTLIRWGEQYPLVSFNTKTLEVKFSVINPVNGLYEFRYSGEKAAKFMKELCNVNSSRLMLSAVLSDVDPNYNRQYITDSLDWGKGINNKFLESAITIIRSGKRED